MNIDEVGVNILLMVPSPTDKSNCSSAWNVIVALIENAGTLNYCNKRQFEPDLSLGWVKFYQVGGKKSTHFALHLQVLGLRSSSSYWLNSAPETGTKTQLGVFAGNVSISF